MKRPRVAIIVGHYGRGTGARYPVDAELVGDPVAVRDEWTLASHYAIALYRELARDKLLSPTVFSVDRDTVPWRLFDLSSRSTLDIKLRWIDLVDPDAVVECHYNSFGDERVAGNEVVVPKNDEFAKCMAGAFSALPNPNRSTKVMSLKIFRSRKPTVVLEPAFLAEKIIESARWVPMVAVAAKQGLYKYFGKDSGL